METRFIEGGEFVDKTTYIETRDKLSRAIERITELEAICAVSLHYMENPGAFSGEEVYAHMDCLQEVSGE